MSGRNFGHLATVAIYPRHWSQVYAKLVTFIFLRGRSSRSCHHPSHPVVSHPPSRISDPVPPPPAISALLHCTHHSLTPHPSQAPPPRRPRSYNCNIFKQKYFRMFEHFRESNPIMYQGRGWPAFFFHIRNIKFMCKPAVTTGLVSCSAVIL